MQSVSENSPSNAALQEAKKLLNIVEINLQVPFKDLSAPESYEKTASFEARFERLKDTFQESHGYKSVMWCVLFDLGRIFQRVMGHRYCAGDQKKDYIAVDRFLISGQSEEVKRAHEEAIETQAVLNKVSAGIRKIQHQHMRKINSARSYRPSSSLVGCIVAIGIVCAMIHAVNAGLLTSLLLLSCCCAAAFLLRHMYTRKYDYQDDARAISTLSYWSYMVLSYIGDNIALQVLGFIAAFATLASMPSLSGIVVVVLINMLLLDDDSSESDFTLLVSSVCAITAVYIIAVTKAVLSLELFYSWSNDISWASIKNKISQCKIDWWRFARGFGYQTAGYLLAFGPVLMTHPWTVIASQWLVMALMNAVMLAIQTLTEEIEFRGPLISSHQTPNEAMLNALVSAAIFGLAHINNPEFSVLGESLTAHVAFLFEYIASGLGWGLTAYLSGGLELSWGMHYANNLLLTILVGYTPSPIPSLPLVSLDISTDEYKSSAASVYTTRQLAYYLTAKMFYEIVSWAPVYLCEAFFRPKYYIEPLSNFKAASMLAPSEERPKVSSRQAQSVNHERQKPSRQQWAFFDLPSRVQDIANQWLGRLSASMALPV